MSHTISFAGPPRRVGAPLGWLSRHFLPAHLQLQSPVRIVARSWDLHLPFPL